MTIAFRSPLQKRLYTIIFEADTPAGKRFDVILIGLIVLSLIAVVLDSVASISVRFHVALSISE